MPKLAGPSVPRRAVARGKARKSAKLLPCIGIDEKAFRKGQNYVALLYDLDRSTVEAISDGNDPASGNACFPQLSKQQLESVEAIAMDMSAAFVRSAKENIPLAETKIAHDRFHCGGLDLYPNYTRMDHTIGSVSKVRIVAMPLYTLWSQ